MEQHIGWRILLCHAVLVDIDRELAMTPSTEAQKVRKLIGTKELLERVWLGLTQYEKN